MYNSNVFKAAYNFTDFIKRNKALIIVSFMIAISIYGLRLFNNAVSIDTDVYLQNSFHLNRKWTPSEGRFAFSVMQNIFQGNDLKLNVFFINFMSIIFLVCSNFLWLYLIESYTEFKSKIGSLLFSIFYISSSIWVEIIAFTMMSAEMMFGLMLCPICVMLAFETLKDIRYSIITAICAAFLMGLHQPMFTMFVEGILAVYILRVEEKNVFADDIKDCFKLVGIILFVIITYFLMNIFFLRVVYRVEMTDYVLRQIKLGNNVLKTLQGIVFYIYSIFIGEISILDKWIDPIIISHAQSGVKALPLFHARLTHGSLLLMISSIVIVMIAIKRKYMKNILYILSWIGMLVCLVAVVIAGGGSFSERFLYALPLFSAYTIFYVATHIQKCTVLWLLLCLLLGYSQIYKSSLLVASDQKRYELDQWLSREINDRIAQVGGRTGDKILVLGRYDFYYGQNFLRGEIIGQSAMMFGSKNEKIEATLRTVPFMKTQGFFYSDVKKDDSRIDEMRNYASIMPAFPAKGCTQRYEDVIIIKLSDFVYEGKQ